MREGKPSVVILEVVIKEDIQIDDPVSVGFAGLMLVLPAHPALDELRDIEQIQRTERCAISSYRIGETVIARKSPRFTFYIVGTNQFLADLLTEHGACGIQIERTIAKVRS